MFNSLNNIRALIDDEPILAKQSINELSNLLRSLLNNRKKSLITLKEELEIVNDYLNLEKIRYEDRLIVKLKIDEKSLPCLIPPMLVQTLVENGIKHGISKLKNGGEISIISSINNSILMIKIVNDGHYTYPHTNHKGLGIKNSKKRIDLLYESKSSLKIINQNNKVVTLIKIPVVKIKT